MSQTSLDRPVIVALDAASGQQARRLLDQLDPALCRIKVGKELFTSEGPSFVEFLVSRGYPVFLDLKFHDIPNTVAAACKVAASLGVWMMDVHVSGGRAMLLSAQEALNQFHEKARPKLIGITVLTSLSEQAIEEVGIRGPLPDAVLRLARLAHECQLDGVVSSAAEASMLRAEIPDPFLLVTPGIRLPGSAPDDQTRIVTPMDAWRAGSSFLVIGRPITQSHNPAATLEHINQQLEKIGKRAIVR